MDKKLLMLREYFDKKGISQKEIAEALGKDKSYVNQLMTGKKQFGKNTARLFSDHFGLSYTWLLTGEGMIIEPAVIEVVEQGTPVYDIDATCGNLSRPIVFTDEHIIGHVNLPNVSSNAVIIRANGDSMEPHINDGDWIAVREVFNFNELYYGQVYLVITEELRLLKYLRKDEDEQNYILLRSENDRYDDIRLAKSSIRSLFIVENVLSLKIKF